jgi:hypothetical protein
MKLLTQLHSTGPPDIPLLSFSVIFTEKYMTHYIAEVKSQKVMYIETEIMFVSENLFSG